MQSKLFSVNKTLNIQGRLIDLSVPKVMGILNVTPDSFFDGNRYQSPISILNQAEKMLVEGADFIDVGGYSSRPDATDISIDEEIQRVIPAIEVMTKQFPEAIISIDTFRSHVAKRAIEAGASLVNDISAGELDKEMVPTVATLKVPFLAMHMKGTPQTMKQQTHYQDLLLEVVTYFHEKISQLHKAGIKDVLIDPGFGFAKTIEQNFELLSHLDYLLAIGKPLVVGLSRKSMIWRTLDSTPEHALNGTTALHSIALMKGASILRAHDVKEAVEVVKLVSMIDSR
ncbi:MAG: dihydropteroate synthase [Cyclobacteriaceae bacterium]|nr:dihydropteroate synthase [Cyclobacteriaceae bacterium]